MRILICAEEPPRPSINGFRLQLNSIIRVLGRKHELRILAFSRPGEEAGGSDGIRAVPALPQHPIARSRRLIGGMLRGYPVTPQELASRIQGPLRQELDRFDPAVLHVSPGSLASLGGQLAGRPTVLAPLDAAYLNALARAELAPVAFRGIFRGEAERLRRFEAMRYRLFRRVVVVSEEDGEALRTIDPAIRIAVVPNGVDAEGYAATQSVARCPGRILFTGVMDYPPNVTAALFLARQVLPRVRSAVPQAHLLIVGRSPSRRVRALSRVDGVTVVGEVPDMRSWLGTGRAYACPMLTGTGIKNKLLEAMANGLPSVATPLALRGISAGPGRHLLVGSDAGELANHLVRVLTQERLAEEIGRVGRAWVRERHSWEAVGRAYEDVYRQAIAEGRHPQVPGD